MQAERAALLAKADLVTDMVGEFPELQGIMGRYYALSDGEPAAVADAIQATTSRASTATAAARRQIACAVALADKLDALVGFFGIGQIPTGDKDPFGLRRAALGVLRILMETPLPLSLPDLIDDAAAGFAPELFGGDWRGRASSSSANACATCCATAGHDHRAVDAVLALDPARIDQVPARLAAVKAFAALPEAEALAAANKRVGNILKKVEGTVEARFDAEPAAGSRRTSAGMPLLPAKPKRRRRLRRGDYTASLLALAALKQPVDKFFDDVMVNAEDPALRANRLGLLATLHQAMNRVADLSIAVFLTMAISASFAAVFGKAGACATANNSSHETRHPRPRRRDQPRLRPVHQVAGGMEADSRQPGRHRAPEPGRLPRRGGHQPVRCRPWPVRDRHADCHPRQDAQGAGAGRRPHRCDLLLPAHQRRQLRLPQAQAGMLREIAARFNADLTGVPAIGDSLRDLQAAAALGAQPMLVLTGKGRKTQVDDPALPPDTLVFPDLAAAAAHIAR
jgi:hypothetical protein